MYPGYNTLQISSDKNAGSKLMLVAPETLPLLFVLLIVSDSCLSDVSSGMDDRLTSPIREQFLVWFSIRGAKDCFQYEL